jgi:hypothetical protein
VDEAHPATEGTLTLTWEASPQDLDLHGWLEDSRGRTGHVSYSNRVWELEGNRLELDADVTKGFGPETLRWTTDGNAALVFAAHNFSGEQPIAGSGARAKALIGGSKLELEVPTEDVGGWWELFGLDTSSGILSLRNVTTASAPREVESD